MFLLQCMQKLHYLDPDVRLYLAGEFEDESIRSYTEHMIETMELENMVFLDGIPKNWNRWLKDKQYIVSTAVDDRGLAGVFTGMAAGLRPVVHQFPNASDFIDSEYLFTLAEDFCSQILEGEYHPDRYRETAVRRYSTLQTYPAVSRILSEIERNVQIPYQDYDCNAVEPNEFSFSGDTAPAFSEGGSFSPSDSPRECPDHSPEPVCSIRPACVYTHRTA